MLSTNTHKLILGTVQLGLCYGINNLSGQPPKTLAIKILEYAQSKGVRLLDSAVDYGSALDVIGEYHRKHPPFSLICKFRFSEQAKISRAVDEVLYRTNSDQLDVVMFHRPEEALGRIEYVMELCDIKKSGKIRALGVSVYSVQDLISISKINEIDVIQTPFNLLDNLSHREKAFTEAKSNGKIIHVRSIFLQGLFFKNPETLPDKLKPLSSGLKLIREISSSFNVSVEALALQYALRSSYVSGVLFGVETLEQLKENFRAADELVPDEALKAVNEIHVENVELLSPVNWFRSSAQ